MTAKLKERSIFQIYMGSTTLETARTADTQTQIASLQKKDWFSQRDITRIMLAFALGTSTVLADRHLSSVSVASPNQPKQERSVPPKIDRISFEEFERIKNTSAFLNQAFELDSANSSIVIRAHEQNGLKTRNGEKLITYIVQTDPKDSKDRRFIFVEVPESLIGTARNDYPAGSAPKRFISNTAFQIEVKTVTDQGLFEDTHKRAGKTVFIAKGIIYSPPPCPYENLPCAVDRTKLA